MAAAEIAEATEEDLKAALGNSWYSIAGAGGDLVDWTEGYEKVLRESEAGTPTRWLKATGAQVNWFASVTKGGMIAPRDQFPADLTILLFPLDGLDIGKLAMIKLQMEDRWFDDVIQNMKVAR